MSCRVVITGLGTLNPCGLSAGATWRALLAGESGIARITAFDASELAVQIAGEVKGFDPTRCLDDREVRRVGRYAQLAVAACDEALADAGFDRERGPWPLAPAFSIYVGSGVGGMPELIDGAFTVRDEGARRLSPFFIPRSLVNLAAGLLAIRYAAQGPSLCISTACASGNHSIGEAWRLLRSGEAEVALAGGCESSISPLGVAGFMSMKALSRRNDDPATASRPFDRERDGFVIGEGAGVVVLETLEHAQRRGARIYAELVGYGASTDAFHITAAPDSGEGAARAMRAALRSADLQPADVDHINAHGTSTPTNDRVETAAIHAVFGEHARALTVHASKSLTGHLLGAAGGLEAVITALTLHHGVVPATANLRNPDPACDLDYVADGPRACAPRVALSNAFGFGGTNAVLAFQRWDSP